MEKIEEAQIIEKIRWDKVNELIEPLREGRHMEEFAASGKYSFDEFYEARMQTKLTNSIWGFITLSYYLDLRKDFDKKRWKKYLQIDYHSILKDMDEDDVLAGGDLELFMKETVRESLQKHS